MPFNNTNHKLKFDPENDGIDHINIYSKSKCELGRMLSHFYPATLDHPEFGHFSNMECFWQYLATGCKFEKFRQMPAFKVKQLSKEHTKVIRDDFMEQIKKANMLKLVQHKNILTLFVNSTLPFEHYYAFGQPPVIRRPNEAQELIDMFEAIRRYHRE